MPQESSHWMSHSFQNLLDYSGHESIPSFGEMRQKGSHMGSLVHMSQAVLFCFDLETHQAGSPAFPQVYVKSYQATAGGSNSVLGNHRVFSRVRI